MSREIIRSVTNILSRTQSVTQSFALSLRLIAPECRPYVNGLLSDEKQIGTRPSVDLGNDLVPVKNSGEKDYASGSRATEQRHIHGAAAYANTYMVVK